MKNKQAYIIQLKKGLRFTTVIELAVQAAKETNRKPIEFISPRVKKIYKKAYPELDRKINTPYYLKNS